VQNTRFWLVKRRRRCQAGASVRRRCCQGQHDLGPGSACVIRNAPRGPGQDALIARPSGAEVPMGSLLNVIVVTVASNKSFVSFGCGNDQN
jgi:hypothetical protein